MVEAVYFGTLIPLLFLVLVIRGEYRKLILFFAWGLTSAIIIYLINTLIDTYFVPDETLLLSQMIPFMEEFLKIIPVFFLIKKKGKAYRYNIVRYSGKLSLSFHFGFVRIRRKYYLYNYEKFNSQPDAWFDYSINRLCNPGNA